MGRTVIRIGTFCGSRERKNEIAPKRPNMEGDFEDSLGEATGSCELLRIRNKESNLRRRSFARLLKRAGLPQIRFHDLRHTCATLLLTRNVHPKYVQPWRSRWTPIPTSSQGWETIPRVRWKTYSPKIPPTVVKKGWVPSQPFLFLLHFTCKCVLFRSGAEGIRTPDLRRAMAA
jgi:hypothetical protein